MGKEYIEPTEEMEIELKLLKNKNVKEEEEENINYHEIIKTVGESPQQYPDYEEFE